MTLRREARAVVLTFLMVDILCALCLLVYNYATAVSDVDAAQLDPLFGWLFGIGAVLVVLDILLYQPRR